jgi:hypothetical protein
MKNFTQWIEEKKKSKKESIPPTITSSPLRGPNQDYNGVGVKHDVANYTISDEKINELSPKLVGKVNKARAINGIPSKTVTASKTLANAVRKAFLKTKSVNEMVAGVGNTRIKPVNMAQKTGSTQEPNAPSNAGSLQAATNQRVSQLDKAAQQQKDTDTKNRETEIKKRQHEADQRMKQQATAAAKTAPKPSDQQK